MTCPMAGLSFGLGSVSNEPTLLLISSVFVDCCPHVGIVTLVVETLARNIYPAIEPAAFGFPVNWPMAFEAVGIV